MAAKLLLLVLLAALTHPLNAEKGVIHIEKKFWKHFPSCSHGTKGGGFGFGSSPGAAWLGGNGGRAGLRGRYGGRPGVGHQGDGEGDSSRGAAGVHSVSIGASLP